MPKPRNTCEGNSLGTVQGYLGSLACCENIWQFIIVNFDFDGNEIQKLPVVQG